VPDEREALCSALAQRFAARDAVSAKLEAISRCRLGSCEAEETIERLEKSIAKAKETDAIKAAAAISAGRAVSFAPGMTASAQQDQ
jgi:hypothetical protein